MAVGEDDRASGASDLVALDSLPKTALQAIYHAVTGKTENLSRELLGNVVISADDIDRLHGMLLDQLNIHETKLGPAVTVVIKHMNEKTLTYSSWERFKVLRVSNHEVTSEITLKMEFAIQLPQTPGPQRCTVSVNLDSSLPVVQERHKASSDFEPFPYFLILQRKWRTAEVSIDFVDFLIAKSFCNVVEEWFGSLQSTPAKRFNSVLLRHQGMLRDALIQGGRIGMAAFLATYVWFSGWQGASLSQIILAVAVGLLLWATYQVIESLVAKIILKRIADNVIPSVILLTEGDRGAYATILGILNSPARTLVGIAATILTSASINVLASYIYAYLTRK